MHGYTLVLQTHEPRQQCDLLIRLLDHLSFLNERNYQTSYHRDKGRTRRHRGGVLPRGDLAHIDALDLILCRQPKSQDALTGMETPCALQKFKLFRTFVCISLFLSGATQ